MRRPIDGDKLKRKVQKVATEAWKMKVTARVETILNQFIDWIEDAPTIEERKTGRWIYDGDCYICNQCKSAFSWWADSQTSNFCPNCGADMRGEQDE